MRKAIGGFRAAGVAGVAAVAVAAALIAAGSSPATSAGQSLGAPAPNVIAAASRAPAPDFDRPLVTGPGRSGPAAFAGRVLVIAFWSSWCAPCQSELRHLEAASRRAPAVGFLGVDVDDARAQAVAALDHAGISYPNVSDPDSGIAGLFHIAGTPTIVVIDPAGRVAATAVGPLGAGDLLQLLSEVSAGQSPAAMSTAFTRDGRMVTTTRS